MAAALQSRVILKLNLAIKYVTKQYYVKLIYNTYSFNVYRHVVFYNPLCSKLMCLHTQLVLLTLRIIIEPSRASIVASALLLQQLAPLI